MVILPEEGKYAYLKGNLMELYGLMDDQNAEGFLDLSGLGDWKPPSMAVKNASTFPQKQRNLVD